MIEIIGGYLPGSHTPIYPLFSLAEKNHKPFRKTGKQLLGQKKGSGPSVEGQWPFQKHKQGTYPIIIFQHKYPQRGKE
ncbi:MAG: hypothetical protein JW953_05835 [Anaerolineae bacterium]|nr:hypothetical protein [Anaerolineae bacterium]